MANVTLKVLLAAGTLAVGTVSGLRSFGSAPVDEPAVEPARAVAAATPRTPARLPDPASAAESAAPPPAARAAISALKKTLHAEDLETRYQAIDALAAVLRADPTALPAVLGAWRRRIGTPLGAALCVALGLVPDARTTAVALDLARSDGMSSERLAGFELLDRIDTTDPATLRELATLVANDRDPRMRSAALYGFGSVSPDPGLRQEVRTAIGGAIADGDPEVRRRAAMTLGDWTDAGSDLDALAPALEDSSPLVRAAAAFALGRSPHATPEMRTRVAEIAADGDEEWPLRIVARAAVARDETHAEAVRRFDEDDAAYRAQMPADEAGEGE